jgi:SAM-dependent methyltransferase
MHKLSLRRDAATLAAPLESARERARAVAGSGERFDAFVQLVRDTYPWTFDKLTEAERERDYLRLVDHHLEHLVPCVARYMGPRVRHVLDFGCGSGGSAIALALVYPDVICTGVDIKPREIAMARKRAELYGVADRCDFHSIAPGEPLPFDSATFDFCQCSSVLEYVVDKEIRKFCVREMTRLLRPGGLLFCSVPNRLYPLEIHTRKWGWNYFPKLLRAQTVDCTVWEVKRLARPSILKLHRTPMLDLFRPWSNFCLRREVADAAGEIPE